MKICCIHKSCRLYIFIYLGGFLKPNEDYKVDIYGSENSESVENNSNENVQNLLNLTIGAAGGNTRNVSPLPEMEKIVVEKCCYVRCLYIYSNYSKTR